jgi:hypothetical protein
MMRSAFYASAALGLASGFTDFVHESNFVDPTTETLAVNTITTTHLASTDKSTQVVSISVETYPNQQDITWEEVATLTNPDTTGAATDFGRNIDLAGNTITGNMLLAGGFFGAFVFRGDYNMWSVSQILAPPEGDFRAGDFSRWGESVYFDRATLKTAVVGCSNCHTCDNCTETYNLAGGALYIYETTPKTKKDWTQTQILHPKNVGDVFGCAGGSGAVPAAFAIGDIVKVDGDALVAKAEFGYCDPQSAILFTKTGGQWSEQQIFHSPTHQIYHFDVEDETIMLSALDVTLNGNDNVGAVFVNYPNTERFGAKPKPKSSPQWSLHQILTPPVAYQGSDFSFGVDVSIQGNTAVVSSLSDALFVYTRPELKGSWSLQQVIRESNTEEFRDVFLDGSKIFAINKKNGISDVQMDVFTMDSTWDCIVVSVEDQFGDGWDGARLQIEQPDGEKSFYAPVCHATDNEDAWQFRFCPNFASDDGLYKLSIVDAPKSKFFWEIQWRVFEESTGAWYQGNHATKMDFFFDSRKTAFNRRAITKNIDANITCHKCAPKPKDKPSPKPSPKRALKGSTHAPTISPAPTLAQTAVEDWQYLEMTGADWFDEQHRGINFYISDAGGHRLISAGTKCGSNPESCWQQLPDGDYILRITGNLNKNRDTALWSFCGRVGGYGTQLDFKVKNGECDALESLSRAQYCTDVLQAELLSEIQIILYGVSETSVLSQLTAADHKSFANALSALLPGVSSSQVHITNLAVTDGVSVLTVQISTDAAQVNLDAKDMLAVENYEKQLMDTLMEHAKNGNLWSSLSLTTVEGSSFFHQVTGATVKSADLTWVKPEEVHSSSDNEVKTFSDSYYQSAFPSGGLTVEAMAASLGYIIAAFAFLAVVGAVVASRFRDASTPPAAVSQSNATHIPTPAANRKSNVSSAKKSVALNALMMADRDSRI